MSTKFYSALTLITLCINSSSLFGYTFINQTDEKRVITIQEAYRPPTEQPDALADPVIINESPVELTVAAKSSITVDIEPCNLICLTMTAVKEIVKFELTGTVKTTNTTYFKPSYRENSANDWGVLIKNKLPNSANPADFTMEIVDPETLSNIKPSNTSPSELDR